MPCYKEVTSELKILLADTFVLYVKAYNYHWNVESPHFFGLHKMFEYNYTEMFRSIDVIAERIRALGELAPGTMAEFLELSNIQEVDSTLTAEEMVHDLERGHNVIAEQATKAIVTAEKIGDHGSADMLGKVIANHQKMAWFLKSSLEK